MTSERQHAANRQNALKSTGPRTPEGRAISSLNATRHGLYASTPVIPLLKNEAEWRQHRDETLASLAPVGQVETALAERVALILWRLGRVARYEEGVTSSARERVAADVTATEDGPLQLKENQAAVREHLTHLRAVQRAFARYVEGSPDTPLSGRHVDLILAAIELVDRRFAPETFSAPDVIPDGVLVEDLPDWTVERLQRLVVVIAGSLDREPDELIADVRRRIRQDVNAGRALIRPFDLRARDLRRQRILPQPGHLDQVIRYERHLNRQLTETLAELRQLKRARDAANDRSPARSEPVGPLPADVTPWPPERPPHPLHKLPEGTNPDADARPSSEPPLEGLA